MLSPRFAVATGRKCLWTTARWSVSPRRRGLLTLAIETSCDDTSVAIVEKTKAGAAKIHFLENITANSTAYQGIHPILALESHQENLAKLVNKALSHLPPISSVSNHQNHLTISSDGHSTPRHKPDFISATRGPGMRANLFVGIDTAKALAVAWQIPFLGVHHMQAHLLTPRLVSALELPPPSSGSPSPQPSFPFLSILASGGHSMLVRSSSLTSHQTLATTADIALGESLDKVARDILPPSLLASSQNTMYGKLLEQFAFPNGPADYADYTPPRTRGDEITRKPTPYGWYITTPFAQTRQLAFSFAFLPTAVGQIIAKRTSLTTTTATTVGGDAGGISVEERVTLAREAMRVCFEHLASRTVIALESLAPGKNYEQHPPPVQTLVVSGGVAANRFLMTVLRRFLDVRGFKRVDVVAPPPALCTDNAAMIGWAGIEMFEAGWRSDLGCRALRKWSLDEGKEDGGVLGAWGWIRE